MDTMRYYSAYVKSLKRAYYKGDGAIRDRVRQVLPRARRVGLREIEHTVAVEDGFRDWNELVEASESERKKRVLRAS